MSTTAPSTDSPPVRRIVRTTDDRIVAGVCGGLGRYFNVDPTLVRIVLAALVLLGGIGAVAYLAAWVLIPEEGQEHPILHQSATADTGRMRAIGGGALLVLAVLLLAGGLFPHGHGDLVLPVVIGAAGALLLLLPGRNGDAAPAAGAPPAGGAPPPAPDETAPTAVAATPAPAAPATDLVRATSTEVAPTAETAVIPPTRVQPSVPAVGRAPARTADEAAAVAGFATRAYGGGGADGPGTEPPAPRRRRKRPFSPVAIGAWLVAGAVLLSLTVSGIGLHWDAAVAAFVLAGGVILAITSAWGGSMGLMITGFVVASIATLAVASHIELRGSIGDVVEKPATAAEINPEYRVAAGQLRLDLRRTVLGRGVVPVRVHVDMGRAVIVVPDRARVTVHADVDVGNLEVVDRFSGGTDLGRTMVFGPVNGPDVVLDAHVGLGSLEIRRGNPPWPSRGGHVTYSLGAVPFTPTPTIERSTHAHA